MRKEVKLAKRRQSSIPVGKTKPPPSLDDAPNIPAPTYIEFINLMHLFGGIKEGILEA